MTCPYLHTFWAKIQSFLTLIKIEQQITLKHLVIGYKITDDEYFWFNYLLTIICFSIYKSYYMSEEKTNTIDVFNVFLGEFNKRIRGKTVEKRLLFFKQLINT